MNSLTVSPRRRAPRMLMAVGLTVVLAVAGVGTAKATPRSGLTPVDSRRVSFADTVFATESNENVDVVGHLHVVTQLSGSDSTGWTVEWHANLDNTSGTGETTGDRYQGTGADSGVVHPPSPIREASFEASFTLHPPGPIHPPSPIRLAVNVVYDETGHVSDVQLHVADAPIGTVD